MVIHVNQVKTGTKIEYEISGVNETYAAKAPALMETGNIKLTGTNDNEWILKYKVPPLIGKTTSLGIPFGFKHRINEFRIRKDGQKLGSISQLRYDKVKTRYDVSFGEDLLWLYPLYQGGDEFLLVFRGDTQIAHIKRDTFTRDLKDHYIIYLPDQFSAFTIPLILFVLSYDHCKHGNRGEFRKGHVEKDFAYSFGEANLLYDPKWMKKYFPQEPNAAIKVDTKKSITLGRRLSMVQLVLTFVFFAALLLFCIFVIGDFVTSVVCVALYAIFCLVKNRHSV